MNTVLEQIEQSRNATGPVAEAMLAAAGLTQNPKGEAVTTMKVEFRDRHGWLADVQIVDDVVDATQAEQEARDRSPLGDRNDVLVTVTALPTMVEAA